MNTTIYLTEEEQAKYKNINPYTYLQDVEPTLLFGKATYPYFEYYSTKGFEIKTASSSSPIKAMPGNIADNEVCVVLTEGKIKCFFLNKFKNNDKKVFYIDSDTATKDNERTWKILEDTIDMRAVRRVHFIYSHFSKLVHMYRIKTIYGKDVVDITY